MSQSRPDTLISFPLIFGAQIPRYSKTAIITDIALPSASGLLSAWVSSTAPQGTALGIRSNSIDMSRYQPPLPEEELELATQPDTAT